MQVQLEHIAFNHDADLSKTGTFFLRRNETQIVSLPEWRKDGCSSPDCAPAGYVIANLPAIVTIKASFSRDDQSTGSILIRALDIAGSPGILGAVQARPVDFQNGQSGLVTFVLPNAKTRIKDAGISVTDVAWQWQFSKDASHWTDFQVTEHRIYTVLEMPNEPWTPESNLATEIHVPWTEVLNRACAWAAGLQDADLAAEAITRNVYSLGKQGLVRWDGHASYAHEKFNCTAFLKLLKRGIGKQTLNCDDCATIVSTFSNVLGCNLFQSQMGFDFFTNAVLLIGETEESVRRFANHAVAWKLNCDDDAALYDACLQVDRDGNPSIAQTKHEFVQPTNLVFGTSLPNSYRFCLFDRGVCDPDPDTKLRRPLGFGPIGQPRISNVGFLDFLKTEYKFDTWANGIGSNRASSNGSAVFDFRDAFDGWNERQVEEFENEKFSAVEALLRRDDSSKELVEITIYQTGPGESPNELLLELIGQCEALDFERLTEPAIGDVAFVRPDGITVLFGRGNFVTLIRNAGVQQTPVIAMAAEIDSRLANNQKAFEHQSEFTRRSNDMEPKPKTSDTRADDPKAAVKHKLAENFTTAKVIVNGVPRADGNFDLSLMNSSGVLRNGNHHHGTFNEPLDGQATPITLPNGQSTFAITLQTQDMSATYNGVLFVDDGVNLEIVGVFKFNPNIRSRNLLADGQNEGEWVIKKP